MLTVDGLLFTVYFLQFSVYSLLFTVYNLLFTVYCLPPPPPPPTHNAFVDGGEGSKKGFFCIRATICTRQDIHCLLYAGFSAFALKLLLYPFFSKCQQFPYPPPTFRR